jgi:predicted nucleic acid-binding protein
MVEGRPTLMFQSLDGSWIAATAIALGVAVVTQDDDYVELPGLAVIRG